MSTLSSNGTPLLASMDRSPKGGHVPTATPSVPRQIAAALAFLAIVATVAALGSLATVPNTQGWYADVEKVAWSPPDWVFGPAWSVLYLLIALAGFLTWRSGFAGAGARNRARAALRLYIVQLILNFAWTPVFFAGYPLVGAAAWWAALIVIVLLVVAVAILIVAMWRWTRVGALLLVPYLGWLMFATTLNAGIIALN
jgi:benzodiazapine receptor